MVQETKPFDRYFWGLMLVSAILLFSSLGKTQLWIYDEVRNAECAREMWQRGDWVVPTFNNELRVAKPPLHYFFMFFGYDLFGISEWGARFFSAIMGLLTIAVTYFFTSRYLSRLHGLISCLVLLVSTHWLFEFRLSVPDPYLIFFNTAALFTAYAYFIERKFYWLLLSGIAFGFGILAKGPIALALPGLAMLSWLIWTKRWKQIFHWHLLIAAIPILAISLPWYFAVDKATHGQWTKGFFLENNVGRFSEPMEGHGGIFLIVPLFVLLGLLPLSTFVVESLKNFRQRFSDSFLRFSLCVVFAFIVFYSISGTKLPNYPMPCYSFMAILLGNYITLAIRNEAKLKWYPFIILLVINLALVVGAYIGFSKEVELKGYEANAFFLSILFIGVIVSMMLYKRKGIRPALISLISIYLLFNLIFFNYLYPTIYKNNPLSKTIGVIKEYDNVVAYKNFQPSFTFYLPQRVRVFQTADSLREYLQSHEALVISRQAYSPELDSLKLHTVAAHHDLFEKHTTILLSNRTQLLTYQRNQTRFF